MIYSIVNECQFEGVHCQDADLSKKCNLHINVIMMSSPSEMMMSSLS